MAKVKNHILTFENEKYMRFMLSKFEGKKVTVDVNRVFFKRSQLQNNYYWLCLEEVSKHTGYTPEECHEIFKTMFLPKKISWRGKILPGAKSTTELRVGEFVEYMMNITREAAEMGVILPSPDEYREMTGEAVLK